LHVRNGAERLETVQWTVLAKEPAGAVAIIAVNGSRGKHKETDLSTVLAK
jgi:hypothetical protein